jgi:hypothetical protein
MLEAEAKERQRAAGRFDGKNPDGTPKIQVTAELQEAEVKGESAEKVASIIGTSARRVYETKKISKEMPERMEAIRRGEVSVDKNMFPTPGGFSCPDQCTFSHPFPLTRPGGLLPNRPHA